MKNLFHRSKSPTERVRENLTEGIKDYEVPILPNLSQDSVVEETMESKNFKVDSSEKNNISFKEAVKEPRYNVTLNPLYKEIKDSTERNNYLNSLVGHANITVQQCLQYGMYYKEGNYAYIKNVIYPDGLMASGYKLIMNATKIDGSIHFNFPENMPWSVDQEVEEEISKEENKNDSSFDWKEQKDYTDIKRYLFSFEIINNGTNYNDFINKYKLIYPNLAIPNEDEFNKNYKYSSAMLTALQKCLFDVSWVPDKKEYKKEFEDTLEKFIIKYNRGIEYYGKIPYFHIKENNSCIKNNLLTSNSDLTVKLSYDLLFIFDMTLTKRQINKYNLQTEIGKEILGLVCRLIQRWIFKIPNIKTSLLMDSITSILKGLNANTIFKKILYSIIRELVSSLNRGSFEPHEMWSNFALKYKNNIPSVYTMIDVEELDKILTGSEEKDQDKINKMRRSNNHISLKNPDIFIKQMKDNEKTILAKHQGIELKEGDNFLLKNYQLYNNKFNQHFKELNFVKCMDVRKEWNELCKKQPIPLEIRSLLKKRLSIRTILKKKNKGIKIPEVQLINFLREEDKHFFQLEFFVYTLTSIKTELSYEDYLKILHNYKNGVLIDIRYHEDLNKSLVYLS